MRIIRILLLVHLSFFGNSQVTDSTKTALSVTSYNSIYKGYSAGGMIFSDTANNPVNEYFYCCYDNETVLYYNFNSYHDNGNVKLDSSINMMSKRKAKITVKEYNTFGELIYLKKLTSKLERNRTEIPKRKDILWNGKVVVFYENKKSTQRVIDIIQ